MKMCTLFATFPRQLTMLLFKASLAKHPQIKLILYWYQAFQTYLKTAYLFLILRILKWGPGEPHNVLFCYICLNLLCYGVNNLAKCMGQSQLYYRTIPII